MELELKHIVGYLGHDLKIQDRENIFSLDYFYNHILPEEYRSEFGNIGLQQLLSDDYLKPILRPLSDLTKEIEVNGEKFVPLIELSRDFVPIEFKDCVQILSTDRANYYEVGYKYSNHYFNHRINKDPKRMEYNCIQKLYEWHFDIDGLIESGLAIDINTLK